MEIRSHLIEGRKGGNKLYVCCEPIFVEIYRLEYICRGKSGRRDPGAVRFGVACLTFVLVVCVFYFFCDDNGLSGDNWGN